MLGTVLLADDDENVRVLARRVLGHLGYDMVGVEDATAAVALYRQAIECGKPFSAVILDLWMPGGIPSSNALSTMRGLNPQICAFVMSGDEDNPCMQHPSEHGYLGAISKTCLHETLSKTLREHLP